MKTMNKWQVLQQHIGKLTTYAGGFFPGTRAIFRGKDLHAEFKNADWVDLYVFSVTGRRFSKEQLQLLNAMWVYTSYPDARLWNNRVAALTGNARSTATLGLSAALAVSEASIYGRGIDIRAIEFLIRAKKAVEDGVPLIDLIRIELKMNRSISGYGRPLAAADERMQPLLVVAKKLHLTNGPHLKLAFSIEKILQTERWRMQMNYAALVAALNADIGVSSQEHYLLAYPTFLAGMLPCIIEGTEKPVGILFPTRCNQIDYEGPSKRSWRSIK